MDGPAQILVQTGLPLALVAIGAMVLPFLFIRRDTRSHMHVTLGVFGTALCLVILGALVSVWASDRSTGELSGLQSAYATWLYLRESLYLGLIWLPILGMIWLTKAQRVEKLRGEDMAREG